MAENEMVHQGGRGLSAASAMDHSALFGRRALSGNANEGVIDIEGQRAIAEAQTAFVIGKRFPRDEMRAFTRMQESCKRIGFANQAFYSYRRGGDMIKGASIRMAEELARNWGNLDYGLRELSQGDGFSEMQAYCLDLETNVKSTQNFTVRHIRDTKDGGKALTEQRDIYEIAANMGARRLRARILAILPQDYVDDAIDACNATIQKGDGTTTLGERIKIMLSRFGGINVTPAMILARIAHPLDQITPQELGEFAGIFKAIRDGVSSVEAEFPSPGADAGDNKPAAGAATTAAGPAATGRRGATSPSSAGKAAATAAKETAAPAENQKEVELPLDQAKAEVAEPKAASAAAPAAETAKPAQPEPATAGAAVAAAEDDDDAF